MTGLLWTLAAFWLGAIPFSLLVARYALGRNLRQVADGNPGATNVYRAGGRGWFVVALALDVLKGALPVGAAHFLAGISGWEIVPIAIAPVLGHAFSPFLAFAGGKAIAVTFGIWAGLTLGEIPIMLGLLMVLMYRLISVDGWAMVLAFLPIGPYLLLRPDSLPLFALWALNWALMLYRHAAALRQPLRLRPPRQKG